MRAFSAVTNLRCDEAVPLLQKLETGDPQQDSPAVLGSALASYCAARLGRRYENPRGSAGKIPQLGASASTGWPRQHFTAGTGRVRTRARPRD